MHFEEVDNDKHFEDVYGFLFGYIFCNRNASTTHQTKSDHSISGYLHEYYKVYSAFLLTGSSDTIHSL